ncbi:MAG: 3-deoxy-manno-octulosonate cytidylyltransferase [Abditibacteriota bacterium]|nr:3-deoxy-manno-octulosonate cytidylyltransferase [Abditibacteriota bacterium]
MKTCIIIPARMDSTRLPGKPLLDICGKPMIQRVYERACETGFEVYLALCDRELADAAQSFGASFIMTRKDHRSGTDRIAEAALSMDCDTVINLQGDEPLIDPRDIVRLANALESSGAGMATLIVPISKAEAADPNLVKAVCDQKGYAMYFSRSPIPYDREPGAAYYGHIGIYAYRRSFLLEYPKMQRTPLERSESLEQLRALENGYRIRTLTVAEKPMGVDTREDYERVCSIFEAADV